MPLKLGHLLLRMIIQTTINISTNLPKWHSGKESACQCKRHRKHGFDPRVGEIPREGMQPTTVFLPGKFHGISKSWTLLGMDACKPFLFLRCLSSFLKKMLPYLLLFMEYECFILISFLFLSWVFPLTCLDELVFSN